MLHVSRYEMEISFRRIEAQLRTVPCSHLLAGNNRQIFFEREQGMIPTWVLTMVGMNASIPKEVRAGAQNQHHYPLRFLEEGG